MRALSTSGKPVARRGTLGLLLGLLAPPLAQAQAPATIHLEAESATSKGPSVATTITGYAGTGYVADFSISTDSLIFKVPVPAGRYTLALRYTAMAATSTSVAVNGTTTNPALAPTGAAFGSVTVGTYPLAAGTATIAIGADQGFYGIDYLELTPVTTKLAPLVNGRAEAENGQLNNVTVATSPTGFSGAGYVTGFDNSSTKNVAISFDNPTAGLYQLSVGYTSPFGLKVADVTVNDSKSAVTLAGTGSAGNFGSADAGKVLLPQGLTTITIGGNYGYYGIDYVQLTPTTVALPAKPPRQLSDPLATPRAQALFSYLIDLYGTKVLAGQQDDQYGRSGSEVSYVLATTGKEPAIVSMDLYDYSSSAVAAYGPPNGTTERYLTWAGSGNGRGITSLIWHWRAPTDLVHPNDPGGAFYTTNTTFNFAAALADTTSTRYHLLLTDIDLIAAQLKKFQAAGVPVLWRPVHETPGTFFWWGAQGPTAFKQLWQLLYTRLTGRHQLHNLIWVYSINDRPAADWYPGDAYVDIASADVYQASPTPNPSVNLSGNWSAMQSLVAPRRLVALSESQSLVNPDQVRGYATWWSWFCAWQGSYIRNQPKAFLTQVYTDPDIITKDKLADWAAAAPLATRSGAAATAAGLTIYPNPSQGGSLQVRLSLPAAQEAILELISPLGQRVLSMRRHLPAGNNQLQVPLAGVTSGIYQLVVRPANQPALSQRVVVSN